MNSDCWTASVALISCRQQEPTESRKSTNARILPNVQIWIIQRTLQWLWISSWDKAWYKWDHFQQICCLCRTSELCSRQFFPSMCHRLLLAVMELLPFFVTHCISASCRYWFVHFQKPQAKMYNLTSEYSCRSLWWWWKTRNAFILIEKVKQFTKTETHIRHFAWEQLSALWKRLKN